LLVFEKLFYTFYGLPVIWFLKNLVYIYSFFHILLWGVIHFQQIYLGSTCMLLFAMSGDLHLTSVWLHMSVGFAVTVQWPISSKRDFTIQFYFLILIPSAWVWKQYIFASYLNLQNTWKIWLLVIKKFETFCFLQYVNCQFKCKVQVLIKVNYWSTEKWKWWLHFVVQSLVLLLAFYGIPKSCVFFKKIYW